MYINESSELGLQSEVIVRSSGCRYYTHYHTSTSAATTTASLIEIELSLANCIYEYLHDKILNDIM